MKKSAILLGLSSALVLSSGVALADDDSSGAKLETAKIWQVDRSGKPPFKRRLVEVPLADIASMEIEAENGETEVVRVVDYRGKPPFRRVSKEVVVQDVASFETEALSAEERSKIKPKPFLKRHR